MPLLLSRGTCSFQAKGLLRRGFLAKELWNHYNLPTIDEDLRRFAACFLTLTAFPPRRLILLKAIRLALRFFSGLRSFLDCVCCCLTRSPFRISSQTYPTPKNKHRLLFFPWTRSLKPPSCGKTRFLRLKLEKLGNISEQNIFGYRHFLLQSCGAVTYL